MNIKKTRLALLVLGFLSLNAVVSAEEKDHAHDHEATEESMDQHEEDGRVHLNHKQQQSANIRVEALIPHEVPVEIEALGEIRLNTYATSQLTPRIDAQVVKRLARLGDKVTAGQALVILSSVAMAEAQGELLVAANEWQRVKKMGKKVISERRYLEARIAFQQAKAKVQAYGMTPEQIRKLLGSNTLSKANGNFTLFSPQNGTVIQDNFIVGQLAVPGQILFEITDESTLWVEARINPDNLAELKAGAPSRIRIADQWLQGKVIQIHHALDEVTRTLAIRIEIPNPDDRLHPGQFVTARIETGKSEDKFLTVPTAAVLRSPDGDWQVYVEAEPGEFAAEEIDIVRQIPGIAVIQGLAPGTRVVTRGAFFVQSEQAKSGFAVHNH